MDLIQQENKEFKKIISYPDNDLKNQRKIRLDRLQSFDWQMDYLCCFYKIATQKFETEIKNLNQEEKIKFLATAYNVGFDKSSLLHIFSHSDCQESLLDINLL